MAYKIAGAKTNFAPSETVLERFHKQMSKYNTNQGFFTTTELLASGQQRCMCLTNQALEGPFEGSKCFVTLFAKINSVSHQNVKFSLHSGHPQLASLYTEVALQNLQDEFDHINKSKQNGKTKNVIQPNHSIDVGFVLSALAFARTGSTREAVKIYKNLDIQQILFFLKAESELACALSVEVREQMSNSHGKDYK